jgi:AAA domain
MSTKNFRPAVSDVFEPRRSEVNDQIYVHRPNLEKALIRAIAGSLHIVIYGESGSGKSWLFKKTLSQQKVNFVIVNGGNAARKKSITNEILAVIKPPEIAKVIGYSEKGEAGASALGFSAKVDRQKNFIYDALDPLYEAYSLLEDQSKGVESFIVLDNLELVFTDTSLMDELASILTLLDDTNYAKFKIRYILVGTRREIRDYFRNTKNLATIANRMISIPEVENLDYSQVHDLVKKGFVDLLKAPLSIDLLKEWTEHIFLVTLGNPEAVHHFCSHLAYVLEDENWLASASQLAAADREWLSGVLKPAYDNIEPLLNEKRTELQRRNQVLYSLSKIEKRSFDYVEVQNTVRSEFPASTKGSMNIAQVLSELAGKENPIIKKLAKGQAYEFTQPWYLMALRAMLRKTATETVEKLEL